MSRKTGGRYYTDFDDPIVPSQVTDCAWLQFMPDDNYEHLHTYDSTIYDQIQSTGNMTLLNKIPAKDRIWTGKWLLFREPPAADKLWPTLKESMQQGLLGHSMKAATRPSSNGIVICIYTEQWTDVDDIRRVLKPLRSLGAQEKIYYKGDEQTMVGMSGSIYCSPEDEIMELTRKGAEWYAITSTPLPNL